MYDDGIYSGDGNWEGFLQFVHHPSVAPWLSDCDLGSSDGEAKHWLLCDLETREVYFGERELVMSFLSDEAKKVLDKSPPFDVSLEEIEEMRAKALTKLLETMREVPAPFMAEVEEKMRQDQEAVERMIMELG